MVTPDLGQRNQVLSTTEAPQENTSDVSWDPFVERAISMSMYHEAPAEQS